MQAISQCKDHFVARGGRFWYLMEYRNGRRPAQNDRLVGPMLKPFANLGILEEGRIVVLKSGDGETATIVRIWSTERLQEPQARQRLARVCGE